jgi:uncharacterized protein YutE (UPF0331/DUF86 family)
MEKRFKYAEGRVPETIQFITGEMEAFQQHFGDINWKRYRVMDIIQARAVERMVENILTALIELAGTLCVQHNRSVDSYATALKEAALLSGFEEKVADEFSRLAVYRNKLAHRYLDIKWNVIKTFKEKQPIIKEFLKKVIESI